MAVGDPTTIRLDERDEARIEAFADRFDTGDRSETIRRMIAIADRETRSPLLYRIKARGADAAFYMVLAAAVSIVIGHTTSALRPLESVQIGVVFMAVGLGALGMVELLRAVNGQSEVGARLREVVR